MYIYLYVYICVCVCFAYMSVQPYAVIKKGVRSPRTGVSYR